MCIPTVRYAIALSPLPLHIAPKLLANSDRTLPKLSAIAPPFH